MLDQRHGARRGRRIEGMRAIGGDDDQVHLGPQVDEVACPLAAVEASTEAGVEPPTSRSCAPQLSSINENTTRPMSERTMRPFEIAALHCTLIVSAQLIRSDGSSSRQA